MPRQGLEHKAPVAALKPRHTDSSTWLEVHQLTAAAFTHLDIRHNMMMMASFKTLTLIIICIALQEGCGLPLSERAEPPAQTPHPHRVRTKRCSCNSWDDKECIYFCHLDIIWVNTPSKLLPYGLGSSPSRRGRRSAERCECLNPADKTCSGFCHKSSKTNVGPLVESASTNRNKLLESFRSVIRYNTKEILSSSENHLRSRKRM